MSLGGAERKGERESQAGSGLMWGSNSTNREIMTWAEIKNWMLKPTEPPRRLEGLIIVEVQFCGKAGDTEALALKPGIICSGAGFLEHRHAAWAPRMPTARLSTPHSRLFQCRAGFRCAAGAGAQTELSGAPHPRRSLSCQGKSSPLQQAQGPPPFLESDRVGTYLGPRGPRAGACPPAAGTSRYRLGTAAKWTRSANRPAPCPPLPAPRSASRASALPLFSLPGLAFPRGGGWGVGEVRRESFRCRQPAAITATVRGAPRGGEGPGLLASLPSRVAARATEHPARAGRARARWEADGDS
ncbi:uncharacterized protein LOC125166382 [Prionailurus viverrinus]|uniref:uncharacterized protein LOC125166382 n=1 Tax=Prionailurus viverrinus TaxID=61388 RepID=UPI001FF4B058|nr:uncharacterized protein LOC125166382 [Prionailurus viverrinus]XP_047716262.1 uncharacterized protein LOC125166382 [Prionailurus viverrinus]XP_047716272.1 uncharacterized protein LOC125166382 [Prionailurus viverrinus]XP_047716280.1 uncharacterized protein LOC125166382 [Prionailurus viverrinus]XP_047716289.1 uncharacterized protein LOC125166382 [Prionailurus viverrinus]XP_047716295.1 uncharacterized protein LOC125166382 [Prionailurus viverrinus]